MDIRGTPHLVHLTAALPGARLLRLPDGSGHRIVSLSGDVWITEQGRQEDIILRAGEAVTLQSPGTALIMSRLEHVECSYREPPGNPYVGRRFGRTFPWLESGRRR